LHGCRCLFVGDMPALKLAPALELLGLQRPSERVDVDIPQEAAMEYLQAQMLDLDQEVVCLDESLGVNCLCAKLEESSYSDEASQAGNRELPLQRASTGGSPRGRSSLKQCVVVAAPSTRGGSALQQCVVVAAPSPTAVPSPVYSTLCSPMAVPAPLITRRPQSALSLVSSRRRDCSSVSRWSPRCDESSPRETEYSCHTPPLIHRLLSPRASQQQQQQQQQQEQPPQNCSVSPTRTPIRVRPCHATADRAISPDVAVAGLVTAPKHVACRWVGQDQPSPEVPSIFVPSPEAPLGGSSHFVLIQKSSSGNRTPSFDSSSQGRAASVGNSATAAALLSHEQVSVATRQPEPALTLPKERQEEITLDTPENKSLVNLLDGGQPVPVLTQSVEVEGLETPPRLVRGFPICGAGTQSAGCVKSAGSMQSAGSVRRQQPAPSEILEPSQEADDDGAHRKELATLKQMLLRESEERRELEARHRKLLEDSARHENMSKELASELQDAMTLGASLRRQLEELAVTRTDGSQETTDEEAWYTNTVLDSQSSPQDACESAVGAGESEQPTNSTGGIDAEEPAISEKVAELEEPSDAAASAVAAAAASISAPPVAVQQEEKEEKEKASMNQCSTEGYTSQVYIAVEPDGQTSGPPGVLATTPKTPRATLPTSPRGARVRRNATAALVAAVSVNLSVRDLSEIKALKRPPPPLRMLMEVCCILFGITPTKQVGASPRTPRSSQLDYWEPARRHLLSDPFLPAKLREFDASRLTAAQRARVVRCLAEPEFTADRVMNCSKAAAELYFWVRTVAERPGFAPSAGSVALARNRTPQRDTAR